MTRFSSMSDGCTPQQTERQSASEPSKALLEALSSDSLLSAAKEPRSLFAMDGTSCPTLAHTRSGNDSRIVQQAYERAISFLFDGGKVERKSAFYSVA